MTLRANSFRSILVDSGMFLLAMTLVAAVAVSANSQGVNDLRPDPRTTDDAIDSRQNTDDNLPDGNPTETFADKTQNQVLGMTLVEAADGRTMVTDVAATSPAWDAGVRRGDQILELHGLKTTDFAKWSKDIRPLLRETTDGDAVPLVVSRRGEPLSLRVKLPVSRAAEVRDARQEEKAIAKQARQQQRQPQGQAQGQGGGADRMAEYGADPGYGYPSGYGGGGGIGFVGDDGSGTAADDGSNRRATNAVAELFGANQLGAQGGRVGMAAFQQSGEGGVQAHVEVHGLPQGNYRVGISDGGGMGGFNNPFAGEAAADDVFFDDGNQVQDQTNSADDGTRRPSDRMRQRNDRNNNRVGRGNDVQPGEGFNQPQTPFGTPRAPDNNAPQNAAPGVVPGTGGTPAPGVVPPAGGGAVPAPSGGGGGASGGSSSLASPASAYTAQQAAPQTVPPPQQPQQEQLNTPATSGRGPARVTRGQNFPQDVNSTRPRVDGRNVPPTGPGGGLGGSMPNFLAEIGMLQVRADGFGQVQNQLPGMNVHSLAGLSVIVVPATSEANSGIGGTDARAAAGDPSNLNPAAAVNQNRLRDGAVVNPNTGVPANLGSNAGLGPVAQGVIRLVEGSGLPPQQSTDPDDMRQQQSLRDADRIRDDAQQRDLTTPPDRTFDPSQSPATR